MFHPYSIILCFEPDNFCKSFRATQPYGNISPRSHSCYYRGVGGFHAIDCLEPVFKKLEHTLPRKPCSASIFYSVYSADPTNRNTIRDILVLFSSRVASCCHSPAWIKSYISGSPCYTFTFIKILYHWTSIPVIFRCRHSCIPFIFIFGAAACQHHQHQYATYISPFHKKSFHFHLLCILQVG